MAIISPFRALRYDTSKVAPESVLTQPYDKISPQMQDRYYAASPYNLVRVILGKSDPADTDPLGVYNRAAGHLRDWRSQDILRQDPEPGIYAYQQRFVIPGDLTGATHVRDGFIALLRLEDYSNNVVHRHEQTLSKPKADRLNLLRATRAHCGQLFMLYEGVSDPVGELPPEPTTALHDEYGVEHRLWSITDPRRVSSIMEFMADKRLVIADGHHRYETALAFRNEQRQSRLGMPHPSPTGGGWEPELSHEYVMATFINMASPGLTILPTHRVIHGLPNFETGWFVNFARNNFMFQDVSSLMPRMNGTGPHFDPVTAQHLLRCELPATTALSRERLAAPGDVVMLAVTRNSTFLFYSKPGWADTVLAAFSPLERQLDVVQLHKLILETVLELSEQDIRDQKNVRYIRDASEAVAEVERGANVAFLMNPVRMSQVRDIAFSGGVMPQKSTDFYPKLLSGLTIYSLD
jgi:uncharacterized protein (DUF1015 family)